MLESIRYHLGNLGDFSGREGRRTFWLWLVALLILNAVITVAFSAVLAGGAMSAALGHAGSGNQLEIQKAVIESTLPNLATMVWVGIALSAANCVLMAAAFVRRLHDGGLPGMIVIVPLAAIAYNAWAQFEQLGRMDEVVRAAIAAQSTEGAVAFQANGGIGALLAWLPLLVTVATGLIKSAPGTNRWGDQPAD